MFEFHFDPLGEAPIILAIISSAKGKRKIQLILDTGAERTQLHRRTMQYPKYPNKRGSISAMLCERGGLAEILFDAAEASRRPIG